MVLLSCRRLTPRRNRKADGQRSPRCPFSPSLSSFGAACVKLCGFPPPSMYITTAAAVSSSLQRLKLIQFEVNMNIEPSFIFSDIVHAFTAKVVVLTRLLSRGRSSAINRGYLHARQVTGSQAHTVGEGWTRSNRCPNGHESAVRVQASGKPLNGATPCARRLRSLRIASNFYYCVAFCFIYNLH